MIKLSLLLVMTLLGSLGGFFFKGCTSLGLKISKFFILNLGIGGILYVAGALLNIWLLKLMPYTIVYPLTSITYRWTLILPYYYLLLFKGKGFQHWLCHYSVLAPAITLPKNPVKILFSQKNNAKTL